MNVGQLKKAIADLPDTMDVFIGERVTDFRYGLLGTACKKTIPFSEEPGGKTLAKDDVLTLEEEGRRVMFVIKKYVEGIAVHDDNTGASRLLKDSEIEKLDQKWVNDDKAVILFTDDLPEGITI